MSRPSLQFHLGALGGVYIREHYFARAGDVHRGHRHKFDHVTLVQGGSIYCRVEGRPSMLVRAPAWIAIDKDTLHVFTAAEDDTRYFCIFALRDGAGEITDHYDGDDTPYEGIAGLDPACGSCPGRCGASS